MRKIRRGRQRRRSRRRMRMRKESTLGALAKPRRKRGESGEREAAGTESKGARSV